MTILLIAIAGAIGTLARYYLGGFVQRAAGAGGFPWGTFSVNMLGCLLFGFVWTLAEEKFVIGPQARAVILVGFMGALTTFSTFVFDTGALLRGSQLALAIGNIAMQNVTGLIFLFLGIAVGRLI
ncbi:MAG: fluoride efflux transporter CrcB [Proteobacteria bacterium]|nr:fluoride efflux transporter CrcB [Pseudomonadota bacterium]